MLLIRINGKNYDFELSKMKIIKSIVKKFLYSKGWHVLSRGAFGYDCMTDLKQLCSKQEMRTIIDVGANMGQSWEEFRQSFPDATIHCIEPASEALIVLRDKVDGCRNTVVHDYALGGENGSQVLNVFSSQACNSLLRRSCSVGAAVPEHLFKENGTEVIKIKTLESFAEQEGISSIDLLKVDTQGYDLEVLKGAGQFLNNKIVKYVRVELIWVNQYENQCDPLEVIGFLYASGFSLIGFYDAARDADTKSIKWCDALFGPLV